MKQPQEESGVSGYTF